MNPIDKLRNKWNAWTRRDANEPINRDGHFYASMPPRSTLRFGGGGDSKSIIQSIYTRISIDAAMGRTVHAKVSDAGYFQGEKPSQLNKSLTLGANIDQTGRAFIQDCVYTLLEEGIIAIVPIVVSDDPHGTDGYDIYNLRVARITQWYPQEIEVETLNEWTGNREKLKFSKSVAAVVENPFYAVMNEPNSMLRRLVRKLSILDAIDEQSGSGKLDLILQLPHTIRSEARKIQAESRRKEIEVQLTDSRYGIAYVDGTERITQLNRPVENNLLKQVEYLTSMLYGQMGISEDLVKGSATELELLNYNSRTVGPILAAITDAMTRSFLSPIALGEKRERIITIRDPFQFADVQTIAELGDKFSRNEIMSANELRGVVGLMPSDDPKANELRNSNMPQPNENTPGTGT